MRCAVAIFAKTIGLSSVKTRLAASIGQHKAEQFYRLSVSCVEEVLQNVVDQNPKVFPHWALAEEQAPSRDEWKSFPAIWTGEGGLGERLANVSQQLFMNHDGVLLIGTDSPHMSTKCILKIIQDLESNPDINHISGPAMDGGFWLWGSQKVLPKEVWKSVAYSTATTMNDLVKAAYAHGDNVSIGHQMHDVDVLEDLTTLQVSFEQKVDVLLPAQEALLEWLRTESFTSQV